MDFSGSRGEFVFRKW